MRKPEKSGFRPGHKTANLRNEWKPQYRLKSKRLRFRRL